MQAAAGSSEGAFRQKATLEAWPGFSLMQFALMQLGSLTLLILNSCILLRIVLVVVLSCWQGAEAFLLCRRGPGLAL